MIESGFYKANYNYFINMNIQEYDISKASISALRQLDILDDQQYQDYCNAPKQERVVEIGVWLKQNPHLFTKIQEVISDARKWFFEINKIDDHKVLYIDNDSITIVDPLGEFPQYQTEYSQFVQFKKKHTYSSFYRLKEFDFLYQSSATEEAYRLKYVNQDKMIEKHKDGFLDFLLSIAYEAQKPNKEAPILMIKSFYDTYVNQLLPITYYREFNSKSQFKLKPGYAIQYYSDIPPDGLQSVDISYNMHLLRYLSKLFHKEYFNKRR